MRNLYRHAVILLFTVTSAFAQQLSEIYRPDPKVPDSFVDLNLKVSDWSTCPSWDKCVVQAKGLHNGVEVGVQIQIARMQNRSLGIHYQSLGESSNRLLAAIARLYKLPAKRPHFRKNAYADLVVLKANSDEMANKVFFFADGPESKYAELYTNLNRKQGVLEIHEKDEDYRANVLKALSE